MRIVVQNCNKKKNLENANSCAEKSEWKMFSCFSSQSLVLLSCSYSLFIQFQFTKYSEIIEPAQQMGSIDKESIVS